MASDFEAESGTQNEDWIDSEIRLKTDPENFPPGSDWSSQVFFNCYLCGSETDGFRQSVEHIRIEHSETLTRDKNAPCIVCPKLFGRMDHLKKHVWSHVNRLFPGVPPHFLLNHDPKKLGKKPEPEPELQNLEELSQMIKFKSEPDDFPPGVDWSTQTLFNCYICQVEIDGFREGVKHIRNFHPDTLVSDKACPCILCPKRFARMDHLKNHLYSHVNRVRPGIAKHNLSTFVRSSTSRSSLKHRLFGQDLDADNSDEESDEEFENWTQNRDFKDFIYLKCDEDIPSDADWSSKILLTCFICQKSCDGFHMAASHMKHIHPGETEKCPICGKGFTKIDQLKNHVWRHVNKVFPGTPKHPEMNTNNLGRGKPSWTEEREWPCKRCDKTIKGITAFVEHLDTFHPNQCGIVCPICDKELPSKRRLKIHVVIHSDKKATCPHCGKAFSEAYKLRRHLREVHDNLKEHVCSTCGKTFARADKLFQHELVHVSKSEQPVEWAPIVTLESKNSVTSDESSDSSTDEELNDKEEMEVKDEKPEENHPCSCKKCDSKVFKGITKYINHLDDLHLTDQDFSCPDCEMVFQDLKDLRKHLCETHIGIKVEEDIENDDDFMPEENNWDSDLDFLSDDNLEEFVPKQTKNENLDFEDNLSEAKTKLKRIRENRNILNTIQDQGWDQKSTCSQCLFQAENVHSAFHHMKTAHFLKENQIGCISCGVPLSSLTHFKIHFWRHFNTYEAPKRGRKKLASERKIWTCKWCPVELMEGLEALIQHRKNHHGDKQVYACPNCEEICQNKSDLVSHISKFHKKEKPSCQLCSKTFFNNNKLRRHITEVHEGRKNHMCNECGKCFARPDKLRDHEKVHLNRKSKVKMEDSYSEESDEDFESDYDEQQKEHESQEMFMKRCEMNQRDLDSANQVDIENGQTWHQRANFSCYICQTNIISVQASSQHMRDVHEKLQTNCILCPKQFQDLSALTIHLWRHFQKLPNTQKWLENQFWKCKICNQDLQGLKQFWDHHEQIHENGQILCPGCDKQDFPDRQSCKNHVKRHHGIKLPCEFCGKFFNEGTKMKRHVIEVHEGRKNHVCKECGKSFARLEKLKQHQNLHQDNSNRPFLCHQCGRGFGRQEHVTRHQKICGKKKSKSRLRLRADAPISEEELEKIAMELGIHNNLNDEGPDVKTPCKFCDKSFRNKRYMMEHYVRHHRAANQKLPHRCEVCGKGFKVIRDLERHHNRPNTKYFHSEEYLSLKYVCPEDGCCRRFKRERALAKHLLIHSNVRNFKCEQCQMAFCTRQTLRTHAKMQHNIVLPTESKKGKKLGPRKNKVVKKDENIEPQIEPNQIRQESLDWVPAQAYFPVTNNLTQWMTLDQHTLSHQKISTFPIEIREQDNLSIHSNELLPEFETPKVKKPRMTQSLLTEEQKQMVTEEMADANLGLLCNVCGKIFKSKDALDFHIMYTKLPGHDILQQQKLKNNYAAEAMRISAKLSDESHLPSDYGPPTPIVTYEQPSTPAEQVFDSKIGVFVKNETMPPPADPPKPKKSISKSKIFKCMECHRGFKREVKLIKHVSKMHSGSKKRISVQKGALKLTPNGCPDCNLVFDDENALISHFSLPPHAWISNKCPVLTCDTNFNTRAKLLSHLKVGKHGQDCPQCGKTFAKLDNLELHVRSHFTERPFACENCDKSYKDAPSLYSHQQTHHSGKRSHLCSECGASFMKSDHLKRHINSTHRKIKTIKCNFCDMMFSDKYKAKVHERKHTGESPFMCDICSKTFKRKEALDNHAIVHKDLPKDFKCVTCGAAFNSQQYLNRHISRHFAEKKHKCRDCQMAFIDRRDYVVHISKVHANHRPFSCSTCGMAYKTKQGLTSHLKSHPDGDCVNAGRRPKKVQEKAFACNQCDKKFTKESRLESHLKSQHGSFAGVKNDVYEQGDLPSSLQQALSQHQKMIPHNLQQNRPTVQYYHPYQNQVMPNQMQPDNLSNEFYQQYAATFNQMYKQN